MADPKQMTDERFEQLRRFVSQPELACDDKLPSPGRIDRDRAIATELFAEVDRLRTLVKMYQSRQVACDYDLDHARKLLEKWSTMQGRASAT